MYGRDYIIPEDVKTMAPRVLNHRIIAKGRNRMGDTIKLIETILEKRGTLRKDIG
ncbi:hypothetical protein CULT_2550004 [[Clostridium] ultunense Esp]|uniref:ChlI/MoxR AAA lid domain-containing protein n=1 Tax=[Clostridium] ultunense Esp TaxID=1288971 RepID=M1YXT3_9FIRM|nr:hypothetical protein [Schnuerera ultunensis]CCQ95380.1 hypothetical protein CULT_2550004 [[Clostridium] ultunense Esp]SHD76058.1 conserved protein of unknown function [[Clostridium] ultunense Esp]